MDLYDLCKNGIDISELGNISIIERLEGMKYMPYNWVSGLRGACVGGQTEIVKFILRNSLEKKHLHVVDDLYNTCLDDACFNSHLDIVQLLIPLTKENAWKNGLYWACLNGRNRGQITYPRQMSIVNLLLNKISSEIIWEICILNASISKNKDLINFFISSCPEYSILSWSNGDIYKSGKIIDLGPYRDIHYNKKSLVEKYESFYTFKNFNKSFDENILNILKKFIGLPL